MSLVHPVLEPSIALNACLGHFLGDSRKWLALQYSNRVVFKEVLTSSLTSQGPVAFSGNEVVIATPQPPMTIGNLEEDIPPIMGGVFFAAGRRKDLLVLQVLSALVVVSINPVETKFELEGVWGLPRPEGMRESRPLYARTPSSSTSIKRPSSSLSLTSLAESGVDPFVASLGNLNKSLSMQLSQLQVQGSAVGLIPDMPLPQPSPDGTQIFLATRNKSKNPVLVVLSCYGKEVLRYELEYLSIMTLGWINNDVVYFVYMNNKFHKKFQTASVGSKAKASGLFGMGRKLVVPSLVYELNVLIAPDFVPSRRDVGGGPDLVFKDYVLLGTRRGTYLRVNHKVGSYEPVGNINNVVGAVATGENRLVVMNQRGKRSFSSPDEYVYAVAVDGQFHRIDAPPEVGMSLSSGHSLDSENRFILKLLDMGAKNCVFDFKRNPMRMYEVTESGIKIVDDLPPPSIHSAKLTSDFLLKTEQALYTRDANGEDNSLCKIVDRQVLNIVLDRPGLRGMARRAEKSLWASFTSFGDYPPEVRIIEESHRVFKLKTKATHVFSNRRGWQLSRITPVYKSVVLVTLGLQKNDKTPTSDATELQAEVGNYKKWETYVVSFVGALSKSDPVKPKAYRIIDSQAPEIPPVPLLFPGEFSTGDNERRKFTFHVYNTELSGFSQHLMLTVWKDGKHEIISMKEEMAPFVLAETGKLTFFTDFKVSSEGIFLVGVQNHNEQKITDVYVVEAPGASMSKPVLIFNKDVTKSAIWAFDSNGSAFREFVLDDVPPDKARSYENHERMLISSKQRQLYTLSHDFRRKYFRESASSDSFRPLPELASRVCSGSGVDAEAYIKTPDNGVFAVFRMQNKKLLDGFRRLEKTIDEKCVGSWLPDALREQWLSERKDSTMVAGVALSTLSRFSVERQKEICAEADFDFELLKKVSPP